MSNPLPLGSRVWWINERDYLKDTAESGHVARVGPFGCDLDRELRSGKRYVMWCQVFATEAEAWRALAAERRKSAECFLALAAQCDAKAEAAEGRCAA